jgi:hypothetical protein
LIISKTTQDLFIANLLDSVHLSVKKLLKNLRNINELEITIIQMIKIAMLLNELVVVLIIEIHMDLGIIFAVN